MDSRAEPRLESPDSVDGGGAGCCDDDDDDDSAAIEFEIEIVASCSSGVSSRSNSIADLKQSIRNDDDVEDRKQTDDHQEERNEEEEAIELLSSEPTAAAETNEEAPAIESAHNLGENPDKARAAGEKRDAEEGELPPARLDAFAGGQPVASAHGSTGAEITRLEIEVDHRDADEIELEVVCDAAEQPLESELEQEDREDNDLPPVREESELVAATDELVQSALATIPIEEELGSKMTTPEVAEGIELGPDLSGELQNNDSQNNDDIYNPPPEQQTEPTVAIEQPMEQQQQRLIRRDLLASDAVGSRNIREIYRVLNSDSILLIGCQASESSALLERLAIRGSAAAEPQQQQQAAKEIAIDEGVALCCLEPELTITADQQQDRAEAFGVAPPPGSPADEDDLEWEFDHEPPFERRDVRVKRGQDPRVEYELGAELGRGKFGTVYRCVQASTRARLAAKFVLTRRPEDREDVEREVRIMSLLQHRRLLQLYDAFDNGTNEMCLITELVEGGELFERIVDDDFDLTERKAAIFMRQICEGVEYMHSQAIVHLDMKPENILCLSKTGYRIKLIDFGLARQLKPNETLRVMFGTPDFAAPEVLAYDSVSLATDMWSVGVICYVLLSGLSPFMGNTDMETMANVTRATYDFDDDSFNPISDLAKDFISKLLVRDQTKRLRPAECLGHAWLARGGAQLQAAVRERSRSIAVESLEFREDGGPPGARAAAENVLASASITVSLDKRNLKKYVVRRKWHKTVHAIMALGRMGAKLKSSLLAV